ncbi:MFS transporter [Neorhizobium lilium]|uniref:MFS transporter n=1 Tax=Neorhizobium lilium TaxID=2503024 RepID=A0A3S4UIS0_9HYPH|nr:MFS transporter [Neorhizobium lilium]RWX74784.1 MFS transporter [Neorhizobium lilium]
MVASMASPERRNVVVLFAAQTLGAASPPVIVSLGGLVGQQMAPTPALTTLAVSTYTVGVALGTIPLVALLNRYGRRPAYMVGTLAGMTSGLVAAFGIWTSQFLMFCLGTLIAGIYASGVQSYRFAAMEGTTPEKRAGALQWVLVGGLCAAVLGPQLTILFRDAIPGVPYAGAFLAQAMMALVALPVLSGLRLPPPVQRGGDTGRPLRVIARTPRFRIALATSISAYSMMNFMMTAGPVAMVYCGFSPTEAALGIQWHVLGMFAPSFVTGKLIQRFGHQPVMIFGLTIMAAGAVAGLGGIALANFWIALCLLGIGWNFAFFGATTMLATCHAPNEGPKVQGLHDFLMFAVVACGSVSSGALLSSAGWDAVNYVVLPVVFAAAMLNLFSLRLAGRPHRA